MRILFCADYWNPRLPENAYEAEARSAEALHLDYSLLDAEALIEQQNILRAIRRVEPAASSQELAIYRGWMLKPSVYTQLYSALAKKGLLLINTPEAYIHCHYLPESYPLIEAISPRSIWIKTDGQDISMNEVMNALQVFGDRAVIVKDFVKSRKHEWYEACYIPQASQGQEVERVVTRFLQLQGEDLNAGLVFREFVEFEPLTTHAKSGMPLVREFRLFALDGQILFSRPYWEVGDYGDSTLLSPPTGLFRPIAQQIASRFFSMDVARKRDGTWMIVELGDGQVAGLPPATDAHILYQAFSRL